MFACLNTLDVPVHVNLLRGDLLEVDTVLTFQVNASVGVSHERVAGYCQALLGDGDTFKRLPAELCDQLSAWREALYVNPSFVQPSSGAPAEVYTRFEAELHDASEFGAAVMHAFRACSVTRFGHCRAGIRAAGQPTVPDARPRGAPLRTPGRRGVARGVGRVPYWLPTG